MSFFEKWHIEMFQEEYLEIVLPNEVRLVDKQRVFFLHDEKYLTCFVHPKEDGHLYFDCGAYLSLKKYLTNRKISKSVLTEWLKVMMDVYENSGKYSALDDAAYVFLDHESHQLHFTRLPVKVIGYRPEIAFQHCLWTILEEIDFDGDEAWLSRLYMLTRQKSFRFPMLHQVLDKKEEKGRFPFWFRRKKSYEEDFFTAFEVHETPSFYGAEADLKTTMLHDDLKTQVLMAGFQYGYLEDENKQTYFISQTPWLIGRQELCHLCLRFPEISKQHARITIEDGKCQIEDLDSTNQTKINGERIIPHIKRELHDLDEIELAGHCFIYHE